MFLTSCIFVEIAHGGYANDDLRGTKRNEAVAHAKKGPAAVEVAWKEGKLGANEEHCTVDDMSASKEY